MHPEKFLRIGPDRFYLVNEVIIFRRPNLTRKFCIAVVHGSFNHIRQVAPMCSPIEYVHDSLDQRQTGSRSAEPFGKTPMCRMTGTQTVRRVGRVHVMHAMRPYINRSKSKLSKKRSNVVCLKVCAQHIKTSQVK